MVIAPAAVVDVELAAEPPDVAKLAAAARSVRLLVRLHRHTIGVRDVLAQDLSSFDIRSALRSELAAAIDRHEATYHVADTTPDACTWRKAIRGPAPTAAVIVNSCAASNNLRRTIDSALAQDYASAQVVVVDNRPATSGIQAALRDWYGAESHIGYASESRPGLGRARNAGLATTDAEIVAFTDDDVVLDQSWLGWLVAGFSAADGVACVTGLIVPLELETQAQVFVEEFSGFGKGFDQRIWDRSEHRSTDPLYPYTVGLFGSGASAAFRRDVLNGLGGFDPCLGIGTPAIGGEDIDIYTRLVLEGHRIVYQPASLLRHQHRRDMESANRQIRGYGAGLTAMLTKHFVSGSATRRAVLSRIPAGVRYALSPRSAKNARKPAEFGRRQALAEWAGMAYGPIGYLRSRLAG